MRDGGQPVDHLLAELTWLYDRFASKYNITAVEFCGCLEVVKFEIFQRPKDKEKEE